MRVVIGIDIGGSTTKIVGFTETMQLIAPIFVRATDPVTSVYGAFGKFTAANNLELADIETVMITGVGSSYIKKPLFGLRCRHVAEFRSIGCGGLYLSGLRNAIIVSMGTGTALTHAWFGEADRIPHVDYLGGTGVGGGTLMGLSRLTLGMDSIEHIVKMAENGTLDNIDLKIRDITSKDILPGMPDNMTASNFGNLSDVATKSDTALGIINMVFETIGMLSIFAARNNGIQDIVLTGNLTTIPQSREIFSALNDMFRVNFSVPEHSQFATVIGAALSYYDNAPALA